MFFRGCVLLAHFTEWPSELVWNEINNVCVCVCMHVCVHACVRACMCVCIHMCVCSRERERRRRRNYWDLLSSKAIIKTCLFGFFTFIYRCVFFRYICSCTTFVRSMQYVCDGVVQPWSHIGFLDLIGTRNLSVWTCLSWSCNKQSFDAYAYFCMGLQVIETKVCLKFTCSDVLPYLHKLISNKYLFKCDKAEKGWGSCLAHPKVGLHKTNLHEAVVYPRVVHLAFSIWKVHNNPRAAIPHAQTSSITWNPIGGSPCWQMLRMTQAPRRFVVKSPDGQGKANRSYLYETLS
jgi:hypothetical protein